MSKKKLGGSTKNGRDSISKRLGFKKYSNEYIFKGNIILRQKGTKFYPGLNVGIGKDYTLFSLVNGKINIIIKNKKKYVNVLEL